MMSGPLSPKSHMVKAELTLPCIIAAHVIWVHVTRREKGDAGAKKKKKRQKKKNKDKSGVKDAAEDPLAKVSLCLKWNIFLSFLVQNKP